MLYSLIGDMEVDDKSHVGIFGDIAYTAQLAWVFCVVSLYCWSCIVFSYHAHSTPTAFLI